MSKQTSRYDSLQVALRRRLSGGLALDVNYTYAKRWVSRLDSLRASRYLIRAAASVPHALKLTTFYDLPVGNGRRFASNLDGWRDALVGGWSISLTGRVQSGQLLNFGNVRLNGMTLNDLQHAIRYRIVTSGGTTRVYNLPQDIIDNTVKAFSLALNQGTLYPALLKLEQAGWISASWGESESGRHVKIYALTRTGRRRLRDEAQAWQHATGIVARFFNIQDERS